MRSTRFTKALLAAATSALFLFPAGSATADDDPTTPGRHEGTHSPSLSSNSAQNARVCSDARQIGTTGYIKRQGKTIGSVKQFYSRSCNVKYGYLWVWQSFRAQHPVYGSAIGIHNYNTGKLQGQRIWQRTSAQEFWSGAVPTGSCTAARGAIRAPGDAKWSIAYSGKVC